MKNHFIMLLCIAMLACSEQKQETKEKEDTENTDVSQLVSLTSAQMQNVGIEVGTPKEENISGTLTLQGKIEVPPQGIVSLSFPLGGYLKNTSMLPGMAVKKGQTLAELEDMQFIQLQQDYLTAREKLAFAEEEHKRQRDLNASKASSDKVLQQAKSEMETQRILVNALGQKLEVIGINAQSLKPENITRTVSLRSPINGYVSKVLVNTGKYTSPTDMLFELVDPRDIHLSLQVFEKDLGTLSIGQRVMAYNNNQPDVRFPAEIILINRSLDDDRMAEIHCHFTRYDAKLVPGMFFNGEVAVLNKKSLTVPEEAVVRWENKFYVFEEEGTGKFEMVEINPGTVHGGRQQIDSPAISVATRLVIKNAYALLMKIKNADEES